jgi:hypothetical protein
LQAGDHDWLKHQSWVMYRAARLEDATTLDNGLQQGIFIPKASMGSAVFDRVISGICASPHTKKKIKLYFGCVIPAI